MMKKKYYYYNEKRNLGEGPYSKEEFDRLNLSVDTNTKKNNKKVHLDEVDLTQMSLFDTVKDEDVIKELMEIEISTLTPLDALNTLYQLQNKLKNRW